MKTEELPNMPVNRSRDMQEINKRPLYLLALVLLFGYLSISLVLYDKLRTNTIETKLEDLNHHLLYQKALRSYISSNIKPVIYGFQHEGILSADYFEKSVLSSAYIAEQVFNNYQTLLEEQKLSNWHYRIAAVNAMNPKNQASAEEIEIIQRFNQDENLKRLQQIEKQGTVEKLHVILPLSKTQASCLHCHGDPKNAPQELIEQYGDQNGFFEPVGQVRGFISYKIDLDAAFKSSTQAFITVNTLILGTSLLIFVLVALIYYSEQKRKLLSSKLQQETHYIAHHDFLTGLKNRHSLNTQLPEKLNQYQAQDTKRDLWAVMIDIDHFKEVNDNFGHDIGDIALKKLGNILRRVCKQFRNASSYRLGGEEFLIVITADQATVEKLYARIQELLKNVYIENFNETLEISAGASPYLTGEKQYELLKRADKALYKAKQQGRNRLIIEMAD